VGDPIVLTFTVSGSGELSPVGLPPLDSLLPEDQFRLPEDEISGQVMTGTKAFRVPVRVTDDRVTEIPALPYSWFDPELAEYQTTYSLPIALSVRPAQVVSAEDVVSARNAPSSDPGRNTPDTPPTAEPPSYGSRSFGSSEADLAIEINRKTLTQGPGFSSTGRAILYGLSVVLLLAAWFVSRRRNSSPERAKQRANEKALRQRIERTRNLPPDEALTEIVAALRELAAGRPDAAGPEVEEFIAACDDILYAPGQTPPDVVVRESAHRALQLADQIIDRRNGGSL
ncbi:hypothetical protein MK280_09735, partial [Myxococcota bacterium]|nr:hypothetical protein [Myxococcota bacterium]